MAGLRVAVTGPTGDLGRSILERLEGLEQVESVTGMARRPFDPAALGLRKTVYMRGDVTDPESVRAAVEGADVVVHLAFSITGSAGGEQTRAVNLDGSRLVFELAAEAGVKRICHASSVAAYGFHEDNPDWLDEDVPTRGDEGLFYSLHKAEAEHILTDVLKRHPQVAAYVFRPCVVAGPHAQMFIESIPYIQIGERLPGVVVSLLSSVPLLKPVIPDPGIEFQLVHEDDVADAFVKGILGEGEPGPYNLAADGLIRLSDLAGELGWYSVPVPAAVIGPTAEIVTRIPLLPAAAEWVEAARKPVLMRTDRAREQLGWTPRHDARETLRELVRGARDRQEAALED